MENKPTSHQSETKRFLIYVLHHPESKHVYIGKSSTGMTRPNQHMHPSSLRRYADLPRSKWIQSLRKRGLEPKIAVLEAFDTLAPLNDAEIGYILAARDAGVPLLNLTDGGDGVLGHQHSDEARAKMSAAWEKRLQEDPSVRDRLTNQSVSYWSNEEAREKKRQERTGKKWSAETKAKIAAAHEGRKKTPEERANMRAAARLRCADPVWRAKQREAQKIAQMRPEVRLKKSQAAIAAHLAKTHGGGQ